MNHYYRHYDHNRVRGRGQKYGNHKVTINGQTFDSEKEGKRWWELQVLERAGEIFELRRQVKYELIPPQFDEKGKLLEQSCVYKADFAYLDKTGNLIVEDTKGFKTRDYVIKRKLMLKVYGIRIKEV